MDIPYLQSPALRAYTQRVGFTPRTPHEHIFIKRVSAVQAEFLGIRSQVPDTPIGRYLAKLIEADYKRTGQPIAPDAGAMTALELKSRAQALADLAAGSERTNGFSIPLGLDSFQSESITRLGTMTKRKQLQKADFEVDTLSEMLILAYEAVPRPIGFAMSGYMPSDWIAYAYQDVILPHLEADVRRVYRRNGFTLQVCSAAKAWLMTGRAIRSAQPTEPDEIRRHINARSTMLMGRPHNVLRYIMRDTLLRPDMISLFRKLLEVDDGPGFLAGQVRDFELARADWNALAEYVLQRRFGQDADWLSKFNRTACPSVVRQAGQKFGDWMVLLPVGAIGNSLGNKKATKKAAKKRAKKTEGGNPLEKLKELST